MVDFDKLNKMIKICKKCKHDFSNAAYYKKEVCHACSVLTENKQDDNKFEAIK